MNYHTLGSSSLRISTIGFGCMSLGEGEAENTQLIHRALELGINFFDTADLYDKGLNEQTIGKILHSKRDKVVLATKVGNQWRADGSGWDWNPRKEYIINAAEASLKRLQTDRIDLYQLHGGTMEDPIDETIEAFEILQQQGKIRYYGISSIRPRVIREYIRRSGGGWPGNCIEPSGEKGTTQLPGKAEAPLSKSENSTKNNKSGIVSVMLQYNLLDRRAEETVLPWLQANGTGVLVRGALAKGLLVDKPVTPYLNYGEEEVSRAADIILSLSGTKRKKAHTALQFVLKNPAVTSVVAGLRTIEQLEEVEGVKESVWLTNEEMDTLRGALPVNYYAPNL
jgi:aryl-alcohol dehydrogenase-like predicted oxidoreductase